MNALIVGARGVGKSTLIRRVLETLGRPVTGFETEKEGDQVHIYDAGAEHAPTEENLVGLCGETRGMPVPEGFDRYAPRLLVPAKPGSIMKKDELGYLESSSEAFCRAVLKRLGEEGPVIAAVKDRETDFLRNVRAHPGCRCFFYYGGKPGCIVWGGPGVCKASVPDPRLNGYSFNGKRRKNLDKKVWIGI